MVISRWYTLLSTGQKIRLFSTIGVMAIILAFGALTIPGKGGARSADVDIEMSLKDMAPKLGVTPKALARELKLPLEAPKKKPVKALGVEPETLHRAAVHLLSHRDATFKYYIFAVLVFGGLMFLADLGRPKHASRIREWYPRSVYIAFLLISVAVAGFLLGKSPNPMEGAVKVFKSMAGLYPDPAVKLLAFLFFIVLAVIGNKIVCGWACPFGALQELIYSIPVSGRTKGKKLPFLLTNTVRIALFLAVLCVLFGVAGGRKGVVLYHYLNPFNLFNLDIESVGVLLTILLALGGSFFFYRPFCQFVCPFGLISWIAERVSILGVRIDKDACTQCGACIRACPSAAAEDRVQAKRFPADCFSCTRCLNVCPSDAVRYTSVFRKNTTQTKGAPSD